MTSIQAVILGIVQGITEFFPISSSAHLILVPWLFNWDTSAWSLDLQKTFDVALHLGTFIAVLVLMRADVWRLLRAFFGSIGRLRIRTRDEKLAWLLLISTVPAAIIGVAFESAIETRLGEPWLIAILLIVFGALMWLVDSLAPAPEGAPAGGRYVIMDDHGGSASLAPVADGAPTVTDGAPTAVDDRRARTRSAGKTLASMRWYHALYVGVAQAAALAPGVSRSGVTLTALRGLKMSREEAVRYAFLLTIPIIGGSAVYKALEVGTGGGLPPGTAIPFLLGTVTALISGYLAARFLLGYLRFHSLRGFVFYRFALGALVLVLIITGMRAATIG